MVDSSAQVRTALWLTSLGPDQLRSPTLPLVLLLHRAATHLLRASQEPFRSHAKVTGISSTESRKSNTSWRATVSARLPHSRLRFQRAPPGLLGGDDGRRLIPTGADRVGFHGTPIDTAWIR